MSNEITYKQWRDNGAFYSESKVSFSACDSAARLKLHELLRLTSDMGVEDFNDMGFSAKMLRDNGLAILVSRSGFSIHDMPRESERITVCTREEVPEPLQFIRSYEIYNTDSHTPLVSGLSSWILMDINNRRLLPVKRFTYRVPPTVNYPHDCPRPDKIAIPESLSIIGQRVIVPNDIDANGHVNNSRYGAFIIDSLPTPYQGRVIKAFRLNYSKEAMLGDTVDILADKVDSADTITVVGKVGDTPSFEAIISY